MSQPGPLGPSSSVEEIVADLEHRGSGKVLDSMRRVGICVERAVGLSNPALQGIARQIGRDHRRALALWQTAIRESRILAIYTADPLQLTIEEASNWADDFSSWEIVDIAADLFVDAELDVLISGFARDEREYVRRCAFAMIAGMAVHRKSEPDKTFLDALSLVEHYAQDSRNYVRKAVNWALRNIGKRNPSCHAAALELADRLASAPDKTARWIGSDAKRQLSSATLRKRLLRAT